MSNYEPSITPSRFARALRDLTLSSLYAKVSEIRNSVTHLKRSNEEMQQYVDKGDTDFAEFIWENLNVIRKNKERLDLLQIEIESRGYIWRDEESGEIQPGRLSPTTEEASEITEDAVITALDSTNERLDQGDSSDNVEFPGRPGEQVQDNPSDNNGVHL